MKSFSSKLLEQLADASVINRANKIYDEGFIKSIQIDPYYENNLSEEDFIQVVGEIYEEDGFIYKNKYNPSFIYSMDTGHFKVGKLKCNCSKFIDKKFTCPHVCAIIKKTVDEFVCTKKDPEDLKANNIFIKDPPSVDIDKLAMLLPENITNHNLIPLDIEVLFDYSKQFYYKPYFKVNFLIGIRGDKKYKITNIPGFLDSIFNETKFQFGKKLIYDESIHYFNEEDEKIIDYLKDIFLLLNSNKLQRDYHSLKWTDIHPKNCLELKEDNLIKFLELFKNKNINFTLDDEKINVKVKMEDLPINFIIEKGNKGYFVKISDKLIALDESLRVFLFDNNIYIISKSQSKVLKVLLSSMQNESYFRVKEEDKKKFLNKVLPKISSKFITKTEGMEDEIIQENLIVKSYLDKNNDGIQIELQYNYGETKINPLLNKDYNVFILRNYALEKKIEDELTSQGFLVDNEREVYTLHDAHGIYKFIDYGIPSLIEKTEVFYSDDFKKIKLYKNVNISSYVKINSESLIDIDFSLEGISNDEISNILKAIRENKKYHKLKDGSVLNIENDELIEFTNLMDSLDVSMRDLNKGKVQLDKAKAFYLENRTKDGKNRFLTRSDTFKKFIQDVKDVKLKDFSITKSMREVLRSYQEIGCNWLCAMHSISLGGILADEMGLGKTIQSIAFMECCKESESKFLIICPSSVIYNWKSEIEKFSKELSVLVVDGLKAKRAELINSLNDYDVIITSYPIMRNDYELYENIVFNSIIIDEAQNIKNHNSQNAFSVKNLRSKSKFALTGTPLENSLGELWSIFDFILPSYLGKYIGFKNKYEVPIVYHKDEYLLNDLIAKINPFILRRLKKDVIKELPEKIETSFIVELSKDQKKLYAAYVKSIKEEIDDTIKQVGIKKSQIKILSGLTRLRQLCCDPSTFIKDYDGENNKMDALIELIEENIESEHKILVFSQFTTVLKNISRKLLKNKISHKYLDGATKSKERLELAQDFNEGFDKVFLISLKAGGTGLNLTGADVVIHYDPWWNPSAENQATDRAHRIGQENTVQVVKIIAKDTIEEKILKLQENKRIMIDNVLTDDLRDGKMLSSLSEDEIRELFAV